jgi:hypothetical protein
MSSYQTYVICYLIDIRKKRVDSFILAHLSLSDIKVSGVGLDIRLYVVNLSHSSEPLLAQPPSIPQLFL